MKRNLMILALAAVMLMASAVAYAEEDMDKNAACKLLGDCSADAVQMAKKMQNECNQMIKQAESLMEKGKMIRGQGMIWNDKEMVDEGNALYEQGKTMKKNAEHMNEVCELIIADAAKTQKKYGSSKQGKTEDPNEWKTKTGDMH